MTPQASGQDELRGTEVVPPGSGAGRLDAEYVLPLRWSDDAQLGELTRYLERLTEWVDVTVVDGSPGPIFQSHAAVWPASIRHLRPEPWPGPNGKVAGVMTGLRHARHDRVVLADDDVRYDLDVLCAVVTLLERVDLVRPTNYYNELPWFARWDTARTLVNRAFRADFPGTLGVRRSVVEGAGGYRGDVLFENLELIRTVRAMGGEECVAHAVYVGRTPPTWRHFVGQRVRQAYDDFAQPGRLLIELGLLPFLVWACRRPARLTAVAAAACAVAEAGRRRAGGAAVYPSSAALWTPLWLVERAVCVWVALGYRRRGVPYAGGRLRAAGSSRRELAERLRRVARGGAQKR
ncbi:MAG TPA: glycosyltransferase [Propionibacteriaceae bacterium]|nr:glycosyltransferase [Propionibacteriaceae bacterium]